MANWASDFGGFLKKTGGGVKKAADKTSDVLVNKDAWSRTGQAIWDGPGGKEIRKSDLANIALDSTMLIPGAGVAGGAARIAARQAVKNTSKEAAKKIAEREAAKVALRSPANNAVRKKASEATAKLVARPGGSAVKEGAEKAARPFANQAKRMAGKQEAGIGTKVGFGQTKKRVLKTAAATAGANALAEAYDNELGGLLAGGKKAVKPKARGKGGTGTGFGYGPGGGGTAYMMGADGTQTALPASFQAAIADFMNQGGSPDGAQVIYLGD